MTRPDPAEQPGGAWQLRLLLALVLVEACAMVVYLVVTWLVAVNESAANRSALAFVTFMLALWVPWLLVSRAALAKGRRWGFTPIVLTQLVFGAVALYDLASAEVRVKVVLALVVGLAGTCLYLLFSPPVRAIVVPPG